MALPICLDSSGGSLVELPLACDPAIRACNPDPPRGMPPLARYLETSDASGLVIPDDASIATIRALSRTELRAARLAHRTRESDARTYDLVRMRLAACNAARHEAALGVLPEDRGAKIRAALKAGAGLDEATEDEIALLNAELQRIDQVSGSPLGTVLDALTDEQHAAYQRHGLYVESCNDELVRRGVLRLTAPPYGDWVADPRLGFPVEQLLEQEGGRETVDELAVHVYAVSDLGKAKARPRSAGTSGGTTAGPRPGAAPTAQPAPASSTLPTVPSAGAADGS
jgi:hypothetical protein